MTTDLLSCEILILNITLVTPLRLLLALAYARQVDGKVQRQNWRRGDETLLAGAA